MTGELTSSFERSAKQPRRSSERATRPFSIRLSDAERRRLEGEAGSQALGTYVRARLLDGASPRRSSTPKRETAIFSQILGMLGRLQLASNLSDLSTAARIGAVAMTPDLEQELRSACRDLRAIRTMLMQALSLKTEARA